MSREARLEKALQQCARIIAAALAPDDSPPTRERAAARVVTVNARSVETLNAKIARGETVTATDVETGVKLNLLAVKDGAEVRLLGKRRSTKERFVKVVAGWDAKIKKVCE
jgi:hypothetical protein